MGVAAEGTERPKKLPLPVKLAVGAAAGVIGTCCIFPIDFIKTRLQASKGQYSGPLHCARTIYAAEGLRGFYRGLSVNLIGVIPEKAIKLAANECFREMFEQPDGSIRLHHEVLAGGLAGFCQVIATNPMEITKVVRGLGLRGMYQGTLATLSRDVPYSFIFFPLYANVKASLANGRGENSMISVLVSGILSGAVAAGAVTPTDVVKTRLQLAGGKEKYGNAANTYRTIVRDEGVLALYRGAVPRMVVVGPLFGITLLAFEAQKEYMIKHGML